MSAGPASGGRERARQVQQLFEAALDLEAEPRLAFLAQACGNDRALRDEVVGLLAQVAGAHTQEFFPPLFTGGAATDPAAASQGPAPDLVGKRISNYEIIAPIATGGMGAVYLARHLFIDRRAAIKLLHPQLSQHGDMVQRFLNEARAANAIRHPHIIEVIDAGLGEDQRTPYILMEYLEGQSLGARLRGGRPPLPEVLAITAQTADALGAAHARGIIHRDLKPENLFLEHRPGGPGAVAVKVLDFGIAKLRAGLLGYKPGQSAATHAGTLLGTPQYMSPEQCRDVSTVDQRTDVYSLGVIFYEMVCGCLPFVSKGGLGDLLYQHISVAPVPPRVHAPDLPAAIEAVILRCLAKEPAERFATMAELAAALESAAGPAPTLRVDRRRPGRGRLAFAALALFVLAAGISAGLVWRRQMAAPRVPAVDRGAIPSASAPLPPPVTTAPAAANAPASVPPVSPAAKIEPRPAAPAPRHTNRRELPDFLKKNPY